MKILGKIEHAKDAIHKEYLNTVLQDKQNVLTPGDNIEIDTNNEISVPNASTTKAGVVKIGTGLEIKEDGKLHVTEGNDGREIELQVTTTHIQGRYVGETTGINLISLSDITGQDGDEVQLRVTENYIQGKYTNDTTGNNLISISEITGPAGKNIELRVTTTHIQGKYTEDLTGTNLIAISDLTGEDGKNIELQKTTTHIQWKYVDSLEGTNLVALTEITGEDGINGKEIELRVNSTHIQGHYIGDTTGNNLIALSAITGSNGKEIELQKGTTYIQGRYVGDTTGKNLVLLSDITGASGKEVELQATTMYIQGRYVGDTNGINLVAISDITGPKGDKGDKGDNAPQTKIQYSTDNISFHDTFSSGDLYLRLSVDNGITWSSGMKFVGVDGADGQDGQDGADGQNATINGYNAITIVVEDGLSISQEQGTITISSPNLANKADKEELKGLMTKIAQNWNNLNTYKRGNWVWHNGCYYHAKQDVPANIEINNTTYWENINDFSAKANHVKTIELEPQYTEFVIGGSIKVDQSFRMMSFVKDVKVKRDTEGHSQLYDSRGKVASEVSLGDKENKNNKVQSLSSSSTHDQYPTAKCVYDMIGNIETLLAAI